jgi:aminopeptidase
MSPFPTPNDQILANLHVGSMVQNALEHNSEHRALVVWDAQHPLTITLAEAYRKNIPDAEFINFDETAPEVILQKFEELNPLDLVVLVQSTCFRLNEFRIRVELFNRKLKVIEHLRLCRLSPEESTLYIESLAYDPEYYRGVGNRIKAQIDLAQNGRLQSAPDKILYFDSSFEDAKLNVGDYRNMKNIGGMFPIGEVFTEAKVLESVHGLVDIFVFGDTSFQCNKPETPITLRIEAGRVVEAINSTDEFDLVLSNIRADEGEVWVRELGFGMNRAFSNEKMVKDIGTYERVCGIHLSLGTKHTIYNKPQFRKRACRHHVDIFPITQALYLDDVNIFVNGEWAV